MTTLLKNCTLSVSNQLVKRDVLIENGMIKKIDEHLSERGKVIDTEGKFLAPGFIDVHVHLREPGGEHKETIYTGTRAAAKGGFTTVCTMPNTNPVPDQVSVLQALNEKIKTDAVTRVYPYGSITVGLKGETLTDMTALATEDLFAFTDDGVGIQTADMMLKAMKLAAKLNKPIVAHCEDNSILYGGSVHEGDVSERLDLPGIPSVCESTQIARDVLLAEATGCHYHACHVSTKESVRIIRDAKKAGIHVTAEVTPHHLLLNEQAIKTADTNFKMNPPLRSKSDQKALLEGLLDGTIDFIATDHAPHTEEEKSVPFNKAPFGIVGLETAFPLLYTNLVKTGEMTLQQLIDFLATKPAEVFNMPYGTIEEGSIADLTLIDLNKEMKINKHEFYSKSKNTPFDQWEVCGIPVMTMVNGSMVYSDMLK